MFAMCLASASYAQYPANGSIGIYADRAGTQCCIEAGPFSQTFAYVIANLAGATIDGITGAEFRIEFEDIADSPAGTIGGYSATWSANPLAVVTIGNPLDDTPQDDTDEKGINLAFQECQTMDAMAGAGRVWLGSVQLINFGMGQTTDLVVRRKVPPSDPAGHDCASLILCNFPEFTQECLTIQQGDPLLNGQEAEIFRAHLSPLTTGCDTPPFCGPVGVEAKTWSGMKELYR
jgi:hypothetical protein